MQNKSVNGENWVNAPQSGKICKLKQRIINNEYKSRYSSTTGHRNQGLGIV